MSKVIRSCDVCHAGPGYTRLQLGRIDLVMCPDDFKRAVSINAHLRRHPQELRDMSGEMVGGLYPLRDLDEVIAERLGVTL